MEKLAIEGGPRVIQRFEGRGEPKIGHAEFLELADTWGYSAETVEAIRAIIEKEDLRGGPSLVHYHNPESKASRLEARIAELFDVPYVMGVSSGTAALHSAYVAADIGCGDEVIVPGYTFMATAMAVVVARGVPVWCEIDESMTLDPSALERKITPRTKAIAPVHMNGYVCDMDAIMQIARRHRLTVIEDCAQACGASFRGRRVGTIGDLGCFSISSYKTTGGGEAGLVVTHDEALFHRVQGWAEAGGLWRSDRYAVSRWPGELFCGLNYRLSELEGSVALAQSRKIDAQLNRWRTNKQRILEELPIYETIRPQRIHAPEGEMGHSIGFFPATREGTDRIVDALRAEGLGASARGTRGGRDWHSFRYMEPILEKYSATSDGCPWECPKAGEAAQIRYSPDMCPRTIDLCDRHVRIGVDQWWSEADCHQVAAAIRKVFDAYDARVENG